MTDIPLAPLPEAPKPASNGRRAITAVVAVVVIVTTGGIAVSTFRDDQANTPEGAVEALLDAAAEEDVLGVLDALEPGERDALRPGLTAIVAELERLDVLDGADLGDVPGVDLGFDDVELSSRRIDDRRASVRIEGGTATQAVDPAALPLGSFVRTLLGDALDEAEPTEDREAIETSDEVVTVRRGDRWYVSIGATLAEGARETAGFGSGDDQAVRPDGAEDPEAAVRQLFDAAAGLDLRRGLGLLSPEMAAVQGLGGLFLPQAEAGLTEARGSVVVDVHELRLRSDRDGDEALVFVDRLDASVNVDGQPVVESADGCVTVARGEEPQRLCGDDNPMDALRGLGMGQLGGDLRAPDIGARRPELAIVVVEEDGAWFVSPVRTVLHTFVALLRSLDRDDLEALRSWFTEARTAVTEGLAGSFEAFPAEEGPLPVLPKHEALRR